MEKFGLIGRTLKHSYSKTIHNLLGDYEYELYELEPNELADFVKSKKLKAFNVTIPYKKDVMPYLDRIDQSAKFIGSVNTIVNNNGVLTGYNTDFKGMVYMLNRAGIEVKGKKVMILGSGGTCNTAISVVKYLGARYILVVSRSGEVNYDNYLEYNDAEIIINTTPVGMYPNNYDCPIDLSTFNKLCGVVDVIYNPNTTMLSLYAKEKGVKYTNGLPMLVAQAKYAYEYFFNARIGDGVIDELLKRLLKDTLNVVLVGMPGSGKSTVGKVLAKELGFDFVDIDELVVEREKRDIPTIFEQSGEQYFRQIESQVIKEVSKKTRTVIATGGGAVKDKQNYFALKSNGTIFWLDRQIESLATVGRPLSKDLSALRQLFEQRKDLYQAFADYKIDNNGKVHQTIKEVIEKL